MSFNSLDESSSSTDGSYGTSMPNAVGVFLCRVIELIVDEEGTNTSTGRIEVQIQETEEDRLNNNWENDYACPLDIYNYTLPLQNEMVVCIKDDTGKLFYLAIPPINYVDPITVIREDEERERIVEENLEVNLHSSDQFHITDDAEELVYGTTFTTDMYDATVDRLSRKIHEGDRLIQGRFGQSIRFSSKNELNESPWSLDGEDGEPVIIIRASKEQEPNLALDNSFIYLLSDQSLDFGDFEYTPESANVGDPMDAYIGSQIVIGSDRLTFVSKADDISISSAATVSIASAKWAVDLDVLMDQLKALSEQVEALCKGEATFTTGVGPTGPATNVGDVSAIVSEISGMEQ